MGIGTVLSNGVTSYFNTKSAMDEKEARALRREREQAQFDAWMADRARMDEERKKRDALYQQISGNTDFDFTEEVPDQPVLVTPARGGTTSPPPVAVQAPSPAKPAMVPHAQPGGIDQGNGVFTYPVPGAPPAPDFKETPPPAAPAAKISPEQAALNAHADGLQNIMADINAMRVPGNPAPIAAGEVSASTSPAGATAEPTRPKARRVSQAKLTEAAAGLNRMRAEAMRLGDANALNLLNEQGRSILGKWAAAFQGDPIAKPMDYARHLAKAKAVFGDPLTMEQAAQMHAATRAYEAEGAAKALEYAHRGDRAGALKAYNEAGNHRFADVQLVPAKSSAGLDSYKIVGINPDGSRVEMGNAFDAMLSLSSAEAQVKAFVDRQKAANDTRKTDAEVVQHRAAAESHRANAEQTRFETEHMRGHGGVKPGTASGAEKPAELLNKYSGWFKSSLQIGDTMMSDIDPKEAAKRQQVYERAMGIAQREIAAGRSPSYESIMQEARTGRAMPSMNFASVQEAESAAKSGQIKPGDRISINGQAGTWQ